MPRRKARPLAPSQTKIQVQIVKLQEETPKPKPKLKAKKKVNYCSFCRNRDQPREVFKGHRLRNANGVTICPIVLSQSCSTCGGKGHVSSYCRKKKGRRYPRKKQTKPEIPELFVKIEVDEPCVKVEIPELSLKDEIVEPCVKTEIAEHPEAESSNSWGILSWKFLSGLSKS